MYMCTLASLLIAAYTVWDVALIMFVQCVFGMSG